MTTYIDIEIEETNHGRSYRVYHDDEIIIESTSQPEAEAARVLWSAGADGDDIMQTHSRGSLEVRMRGRISSWAVK